jgi:peptidoglycan/LPS O-acetylase OafA/YrhL
MSRAARQDGIIWPEGQLSLKMAYRPDIDGLRSVAVVPVVLFHFGINAVSGGFVGVDIFFVISGYLITTILAQSCGEQRLSLGGTLLDFYARRVKRIFPVLFVVVLATLAAGYLLLSPGDYEAAGKSAIFTVTFLSNVFFWLNTGYFDAAAETMPLLHTWSLGVEEQFYIVWPLLIFVLWKLTRLQGRAFWSVLIGFIAISFAACVVVTTYDPQQAFYLPWFRAWQFAMGAAIAFLPTLTRGNHAASVIGILLIAWAVFGFDESTVFPGYSALVPTLGAALIIVAGPAGVANRVLSMPPFVWVGLISYSLYLWHWPVTVLYMHYSDEPLSIGEIAALGAVMTGLSILSYVAIERPFRRIRFTPSRIITTGIAGGVAVVAVSLVVVQSAGFPARLPDEMKKIASLEVMWEWECPQRVTMEIDGKQQSACVIGAPWETAKSRGVLWGDSHAQHFAPVFDRVGQQTDTSFVLRPGCAAFFVPGIMREIQNRPKYSERCWATNDAAVAWINGRPEIDTVLIANAWAGYAEELFEPPATNADKTGIEAGAALEKKGLDLLLPQISSHKTIVLIGDVPRPFFHVPPCIIREAGGLMRAPCPYNTEAIPLDTVERFQRPTYRALAEAADKLPNASFFNPSAGLCDDEGCPLFEGTELIYRDNNHWRRNLSTATIDGLISKMGLLEFLALQAGTQMTSIQAQ